jgi:Ser/Thr protein kinase RdoA (MazF antagonist)
VELLGQGRMAEVFAYGDGRVVKLDRPEWNGVAPFEAEVIDRLAEAGLPVARTHGVVTIDGRSGVVLDRVDGHPLLSELLECDRRRVRQLANRFAILQCSLNAAAIGDLPDLMARLHEELRRSGLPQPVVTELAGLATRLDDGRRTVCHFDFHPLNVLVGAQGWVVIDWVGVAAGPPVVDLARTLVLWGRRHTPPVPDFLRQVRRRGLAERGVASTTCDQWIRVVAGARLAEGFEGEEADWLRAVAEGVTHPLL